ncbi:hypothetical protein HPB52_019540 [Rhipicephalus sanguineus]|uniref:Peptidase S1 domain-containing protein n=1 Tax=Rhipicephalus sanguineus TaxID=34632 RepID=A0A9D4SQ30_RHISA|nr:hypothetical protein HPB52_019540 [Rhipicephalus sanguineus]
MIRHPEYDDNTLYKDIAVLVGDTGGPAISRVAKGRDVQVGIVSFGSGCAERGTPGVYTRVEAFTPWLQQVVGSLDQASSSKVPLQHTSCTAPQ